MQLIPTTGVDNFDPSTDIVTVPSVPIGGAPVPAVIGPDGTPLFLEGEPIRVDISPILVDASGNATGEILRTAILLSTLFVLILM